VKIRLNKGLPNLNEAPTKIALQFKGSARSHIAPTGANIPDSTPYSEHKKAPAFMARRLFPSSRLHDHEGVGSIAVVISLVGTSDCHAKVFGLQLREDRELDADTLQMKARDFLVEVLR